jgi:AcrR family transcriptional regulator
MKNGPCKSPSSRPALRRRNRPTKTEQILEAARASFLEHGYERTSMDSVARDAGVSKATVYVHFSSKQALLHRLIEDEFTLPMPLLQRAPGAQMDIEAALKDIARNFTQIFLDSQGLGFHRLIMANASQFPEIAETFMNAGPRKRAAEVGALLQQAVELGLLDIDNIDLAVKQFFSLVQCDLPLNWALSMSPPEQSEYDLLIEEGVRVFLAAYGGYSRMVQSFNNA